MHLLLHLLWLLLFSWFPTSVAGCAPLKANVAAFANADDENQIAAGETHRFRYIQRAAELVVLPEQRQESQRAEQHLWGLAAGRLALLSNAGAGTKAAGTATAVISLGLSSSDIIFPFHYFW
ncbi:hypothetical protein [Pontibacter oryzae]|uniref:Uncharacterized protein n=1 Tax=Pontibacter oryzae TaxID=2304593 RepID=A0A399RVH5_9BACT|nr:hypothetical protein [Pontibacter oryzae]RIJ34323.1 hypothetical protein D1627_15490 [Pontibacter oryzae]